MHISRNVFVGATIWLSINTAAFAADEWVNLAVNGNLVTIANVKSGELRVRKQSVQSLGFNPVSSASIDNKFLSVPWKSLGAAPVADAGKFPSAIYFLNTADGSLAVCRVQRGNAAQCNITAK